MKKFAAIVLVLSLAACGAPKAPQGQSPQQSQAQPSTPSQPSTATATPTPTSLPAGAAKPSDAAPPMPELNGAFLIGRWGDNGDCSKDVVFNVDGSFASYTGGEGAWALSGETLHMEGKTGAYDLQLQMIDENTLRVTNPDGSVGRSQRC